MWIGHGATWYTSVREELRCPNATFVYFFAIYFITGFERLPGQSDLDFVLDIAADRGKMSLVGGKRGNTLSAEDLADLNRSLVNIKAGRQKGEDAFSQDAAEQEDTLISAAATAR